MSTRVLIQDHLQYNHIPTVGSLSLADQFLLLGDLEKRTISERSPHDGSSNLPGWSGVRP